MSTPVGIVSVCVCEGGGLLQLRESSVHWSSSCCSRGDARQCWPPGIQRQWWRGRTRPAAAADAAVIAADDPPHECCQAPSCPPMQSAADWAAHHVADISQPSPYALLAVPTNHHSTIDSRVSKLYLAGA